MITDPSTPDITGRVLEFFGTYTQNELPEKQKQSAINWLMNVQEENGSWYGKWGICYIYGTWAVLTGLRSLGIPSSDPSVKRALYGLNIYSMKMVAGENLAKVAWKKICYFAI